MMMKKIYATSCIANEKKLIMRIKKMKTYENHNRADTGLFLFQSSIPGGHEVERRLIEIKCSTYLEALKFSAIDIIPNVSKIGVYFVEDDDCVLVYVSGSQYHNLSMTVITCDNTSIYDFKPYSTEVMSEDMIYTKPVEMGSIEEVSITMGDGMSLISASKSCNKLFYNHNTKTIDGELIISPSATGYKTIFSSPSFIQTVNGNEGLIYMACAWVASDGVTVDSYELFPVQWNRTEHVFQGRIPTNTQRIVIPIHTYLAEGLLDN